MEKLIALAGRARGGDRAALQELLIASAGLVHAVTRARLGGSLAAEGAAVEALSRAAQGLPGLKDPQAYPHWLYRIATRSAQDARPPLTVARPPERADPAGGPVETLVAAERAQRVRDEVAVLPAKLREPLFLHYVEGLPYREIARVLDTALSTVSRRMERALSILRKRLGENA
jgi:RNA polymerase sigma-70 factor (ECF subfamily)